MNIVFCVDRTALPGLHVAAYSVLDRFSLASGPLNFTVFCGGLSLKDRSLLKKTLEGAGKSFSLEFRPLDPVMFANFRPLYGSVATYYRLFAAEQMEVERFLYLDADTLCDMDVSGLAAIEMGASAAALVAESTVAKSIDRYVADLLGNRANETYFNAGVMLVNVPEWRKQEASRRCVEFIEKHRAPFFDQSAINVVLRERILPLDEKFNFMSNRQENWRVIQGGYGRMDRLVHFLDYPKPWSVFAEYVHPQHGLWKSVLDRTEMRHFRNWRATSPFKLYRALRAWRNYRRYYSERVAFLGLEQQFSPVP